MQKKCKTSFLKKKTRTSNSEGVGILSNSHLKSNTQKYTPPQRFFLQFFRDLEERTCSDYGFGDYDPDHVWCCLVNKCTTSYFSATRTLSYGNDLPAFGKRSPLSVAPATSYSTRAAPPQRLFGSSRSPLSAHAHGSRSCGTMECVQSSPPFVHSSRTRESYTTTHTARCNHPAVAAGAVGAAVGA